VVQFKLKLVMSSGSKSRVEVPKMSGFIAGFWVFYFPTISLLMGSGSKSWVRVGSGTKKVGFPPGFRVLRVPEPITNWNIAILSLLKKVGLNVVQNM